MKLLKCLLLCTLTFSSVASMAESEFLSHFTKPKFDFDLSAFHLTEEALLSNGTATVIGGHFGYVIEDGLSLNLKPVISFIGGQQTSRDPQSPLTNTLYLKEATVEKKMSDNLIVKLGSLYQKEFLPGLSGHTKSFPGFGLIIPYEIFSNQFLNSKWQGAVITSSGLATSSNELVTNSSLFSATIELNSKWRSDFVTVIRYSYFKFEHLPSSVASDSINRGNTIVRPSASLFNFVYGYAGDEVSLAGIYTINNSFDLKWDTHYIKNSLAPKNLNSGYSMVLAPGYVINSKYTIRPYFQIYSVQADAMVANYIDTSLGRTNRRGNKIGSFLESKKYQLELNYASSKLVNSNPFQSADRSLFLNLSINEILF